MAKFNPKLAEASAPLRSLLSAKNQWLWTEEHTKAFQEVKKVIQSPTTLKLYDVSKPTKLRVDGSRLNGISAILYQQHEDTWHPVTCASRYLTDTEKRYYPIENEMLAVTWGCHKMNMYLHGLPHFNIQTDHKPLVPILNHKSIVEMSPRIQNMRMKLLKYTFTAEHVPGVKMEDADALSRAPNQAPTKSDEILDEEITCHVNEIIEQMPVSSPYLKKIKKLTKTDSSLQLLQRTMMKGWPTSKQSCPPDVQPFWDSRHDLTVVEDLVIKGSRIVIPKKLQAEVLEKLHSAHQGMDRTKRRARQSIYWPNMNREIEKLVNKCTECLKHKPSKQKETLKPRPVPTRPWEKVGSDLFHLGGNNYIVITDYYSLWPEVYQLKQATSASVISTMKDVFARHGIPTELVSDNGSQYKSAKFRRFSTEWNFEHNTSSPRYPKSNGLAESSVKTVKMMMKKCLATNKDIKQGLLSIRNTPLACGFSPAELLMNRQLNDNLPRLPAKLNASKPKIRDLVEERKQQKAIHDSKVQKRDTTIFKFKPGQHVALQDPATKLWTGRGTIIEEVAPRSFEIRVSGGGTLRRNQCHIRKLHSTTSTYEQHQEDPVEEPDVLTEDDSIGSDSETSTLHYDDDGDWFEELSQPEEGVMSQVIERNSPQPKQTLTTTLSGRVVKPRRPMDYEEI